MAAVELAPITRDGAIATVTLNRPEKLNALNLALWKAVGDSVRALSKDDSVRCIVLRGAGDKSFSPGADIAEFAKERANAKAAARYAKITDATLIALATCRHPTVAMLQGLCVGGGLEVASVCDLRICGEGTRLGVPVARIGVTVPHLEMKALIDLVGYATALEILLEGRVFGAAEAKEKGLVTRVVPAGALETETYATAQRIAAGAPLGHRWHKKFARRMLNPKQVTRAEYLEGFKSFDTADFREGYRSFLEKRAPKFTGR